MIICKLFGVEIRFHFYFFALLSMMLMLDRTGVLACAFFASCLHEVGHIFAFLCCRAKPEVISFELSGVRMISNSAQFSTAQQAFILSAGCVVNFSIVLMTWNCGNFIVPVVHFCLGLFNLLPVAPLDGGKLLFLLLQRRFRFGTACLVLKIISYLFCGLLLIFGLYLTYYLNFSLLITAVYLSILVYLES